MSLRVTLVCQVAPNQFSTLQPFLVENLPNVRSFDGCMGVTVYFNEDTHSLLLEEEWLSQQQHGNYLQSITDNGIMAKLGSFLAGPPTIEYFSKQVI
ncbi:hypothetical protein A9Q99_24055 [Gammaproteobacteria bacterium 45_16_T64]|nr:hypothetical protein A9Q99_24055 [Gammaproteobacteria bacterium 45_16_T64]